MGMSSSLDWLLSTLIVMPVWSYYVAIAEKSLIFTQLGI